MEVYPSDLSDDEWALLEPLIPPEKPGGCCSRSGDLFLRDHALGGWKTGARAHTDEFLDTTVTCNAPFEDAFDRGMERYQQLVREGWFNRDMFDPTGFAHLLDIKVLHNSGIHPME